MTDRAQQRRTPQLLPPDVTHFTDRESELGTLDALLTTSGSEPPAAVVISAIAGTAGMGKTSLAVRWAHRVRERFPDGQLYVNLRGYDPGPRVTPDQALEGFLRAMDVPGEAIPHDVDAMAGYYRSLLAGRRMLVVLDNAATPDQVRPLLPASPTCVVLVTSRSRLSGLVAREGGHRITLDLLPPDEAIILLRRIIGAARADIEPRAVDELARRCAYLPLALRIAAERVTARPHLLIADLVTDLTHEQDRLDTLAVDDDETATVRTVFSWSYRALAPEAARMFRLLGLHPGPTISAPAAAALTDCPPAKARRLLDALASAHLLEEIGPDRYTFHDLLRAYATDRATTEEPELERHAATSRIFEWYLHTAYAASRVLWPHQHPLLIGTPDPDCRPLAFSSYDDALGWFDAEQANLMVAVDHAADIGWFAVASQLPTTMFVFLRLRARWADVIMCGQIGLTAAQQLQDQRMEVRILANLSDTYIRLERLDDAMSCAQRELGITREIGDRKWEGSALHGLGIILLKRESSDEAIDHLQRGLDLYREVGDQRGQSAALTWLGEAFRLKQRYGEALDYLQQGIAILQAMHSRYGESFALRHVGLVYQDLHRFDDAIDAFEQAHAIHNDLDHRYEAACTLQDLGEARYSADEPDKARQCWEEALAVFDDLNSPRAAEVRARLDVIDGRTGPA